MSKDKTKRARRPAETWLFETMRLGPARGFAVMVAVIYGLFITATLVADGLSILDSGSPYLLSVPAWSGLVLSLVISAGTALLYYGRLAPHEEHAALIEALGEGEALDRVMEDADTAHWSETAAFWAGIVAGLGLAWVMLEADGEDLAALLTASRIWFTIFIPLSIGLLFRAFVSSQLSDGVMRRAAREGYRHDTLRPERSFVFGRLALRGALTWFLMAAIIMLFFVHGVGSIGAVLTAVVAIGGALSSLIGPLTAVRGEIRKAKETELDRLHAAMREARSGALNGDAGAAQRLGGLAAYEQAVRASPDWPVSAPVTTRFFLYILIPIVPWFGSAMAERIVMEMAR